MWLRGLARTREASPFGAHLIARVDEGKRSDRLKRAPALEDRRRIDQWRVVAGRANPEDHPRTAVAVQAADAPEDRADGHVCARTQLREPNAVPALGEQP